jgi:hypothetical protein
MVILLDIVLFLCFLEFFFSRVSMLVGNYRLQSVFKGKRKSGFKSTGSKKGFAVWHREFLF